MKWSLRETRYGSQPVQEPLYHKALQDIVERPAGRLRLVEQALVH